MNPRRPYSNRPGGRRGFSSGGGQDGNTGAGGNAGGNSGGGGGRGFGGGGGKPPPPPMLLGEPSPSLGKINAMNIVKLQEKIVSLKDEQSRMAAKLEKLLKRDPAPQDQVEAAQQTIVRLKALEAAAATRLAGKLERKALRERRDR